MIFARVLKNSTVLAFLFFLPCFLSAYAQTNSFTVRQQIGNDTVPPTTPAFISATPIATTQIDISWASSTDDQFLGGYLLYRDAVHIATTSLTTYSDTGLTPSTTYTYTVAAYDWLLNVSTTSASVSTTTFQVVIPSVATSTDGAGGTRLVPQLTDMQIDETQEGALLTWSTNIYVRYALRWGLTNEYELGFVQSDSYRRDHITRIDGLSSDTTYQYELVSYNQNGKMFVLDVGTFKTKQVPDTSGPANVSNAQLLVEGQNVFMSWKNPVDDDFAKVRVVRNPLFYPANPNDGFIVFEGSAESMLDTGVLATNDIQYYTIFAYDRLGNVSSGVLLRAQKHIAFPGTGEAGRQDVGIEDDAEIVHIKNPSASTGSISFADALFKQGGVYITHDSKHVVVDDDRSLYIQLPVELFPKHLKTITVTLAFDNHPSQTYMLRINRDKTVYSAHIGYLSEGVHRAYFSVYDYQLQRQTLFAGDVVATSRDMDDTVQLITPLKNTYGIQWMYGALSFLLLFIIFWWFILLRRSREDN